MTTSPASDASTARRSTRLGRAGVGAALAACEAVHARKVRNAFVCSRPPGHHARNDGEVVGFCLYNNVAVAARYLQRRLGYRRILIVDWDYHHGDGTESFFYEDPSVLLFDTHDWRAYPRTGDPGRRGGGDAVGTKISVDLPCGATDAQMLRAFDQQLLPAAEVFRRTSCWSRRVSTAVRRTRWAASTSPTRATAR
jgi:acetoin utilization deacetylase AcuC-like enzyme